MRTAEAFLALAIVVPVSLVACANNHSDIEVTSSSQALVDARVCLFGTERVTVGGRSRVGGYVMSNGTVVIQAGGSLGGVMVSTTVDGSVVSVGEANLGSAYTHITGNVTAATLAGYGNTTLVDGKVVVPATVLSGNVPSRTVTPGTQPIDVASPNCRRSISPGSYADAKVSSGCNLTLVGSGTYRFKNLSIWAGGKLTVAAPPVQIDVAGNFVFDSGATLDGVSNPANLGVYANGTEVRFSPSNKTFRATVVAPNAGVRVGRGLTFDGCIQAKTIDIETDVTHHPIPLPEPQIPQESGTLTRSPVVFRSDPDAGVSGVLDIEISRDPSNTNCVGMTRVLLPAAQDPQGRHVIHVAACSMHFEPCEYDPTHPTGAPSCFDSVTHNLLPQYTAYYNLYKVLKEYNDLDMGITFDLSTTGTTHVNAVSSFPVPDANSPEILVEMVNDMTATGGAASYFDSSTSQTCRTDPDLTDGWHIAYQNVATKYTALILDAVHAYNINQYRLDPDWAPGIPPLKHELAHILGFTEHTWRRYDYAPFMAPTANFGLFNYQEPDKAVITAYQDWLVDATYDGDNLASSTSPWRVHDLLQKKDPARLDLHSDLSTAGHFDSLQPRHLVWDPVQCQYLDCRNGRTPVFTAQFSEVGADPSKTAVAKWKVSYGSDLLQTLPVTLTGVGAESAWAQWEWRTPVLVPYHLSLPRTSGSPQTIQVELEITSTQSNASPHRSAKTAVTVYPSGTTDPRCAASLKTDQNAPSANGFGAAIVRGKEPYDSLVIIGEPQRSVDGNSNVGAVVTYAVDDPLAPTSMTQKATLFPPSGFRIANLRVGTSVAYGMGITDGSNTYDMIAVGAPNYDYQVDPSTTITDMGAVFIYYRNRAAPEAWSEAHVLFAPTWGQSYNARYGESLAFVSRNGHHYLVVGAPGTYVASLGGNTGAVWVHHVVHGIAPTTWAAENLEFPEAVDLVGADFGYALATSGNTIADDPRLVVGAPGFNNDQGGAWNYEYISDGEMTWDECNDNPVDNDGDGSVDCNDAGCSSWWHCTSDPGDDPPLPFYRQPWTLGQALDIDGVDPGSADRQMPPRGNITDLPQPAGPSSPGSRFGSAISVEGLHLAVGAPEHDFAAGAVYLYRYPEGYTEHSQPSWHMVELLRPASADRHAGDRFGAAVEVPDQVTWNAWQGVRGLGFASNASASVLVGAPGYDAGSATDAGALYVYDFFDNPDLSLTMTKTGASANAQFGSAISAFKVNVRAEKNFGALNHYFWHDVIVGSPGVGNFTWYNWDRIDSPTPCSGLCTIPTTIAIGGDGVHFYQIGTAAMCLETTSVLRGGNCGNFASTRTLSVNGTAVPCNYQNWAYVPPARNGGYCIAISSGDYSYAYLNAF